MNSILSVFFFLAALISGSVFAKSTVPEISAADARILIPMKGTTVTAGYATIKNDSSEEVSLVITRVKPFKAVELHETYEAAGKMGMRKIAKILVPAHQSFELKPGASHIMLFDPIKELKIGETVEVSFTANGKALTLKFRIVDRDENTEGQHH